MKPFAMMFAVFAVFAVVAVSCGGDDVGTLDLPGAVDTTASDASGEVDAQVDADVDEDSEPGAATATVAPADMNTIRIGSQVWERTLPMTTGQCFVQNVDGLPPSGVAWGTLDDDDDISFSAGQNQDGTNEARVEDQEAYYWIAGPRVADGPEDLEVELDFDALIVRGRGTFTNLFTGETAPGSFAFQCEDDGSGS